MKLVSLIITLLIASPALATGGAEGNGSAGFLCQDGEYKQDIDVDEFRKKPGKIIEDSESFIIRKWSVFYDLWEAEQPKGLTRKPLTIVRSPWTSEDADARKAQVKAEIDKAMARLKVSNEKLLYPMVVSMRKRIEGLNNDGEPIIEPAAKSLALPPDLKAIHENSQCQVFRGAARWVPRFNSLLYDKEMVEYFMSPTDEAAMWIHEYIYAALTEAYKSDPERFYLSSSYPVRFITAFLFSDVKPKDFPFAEHNHRLRQGNNYDLENHGTLDIIHFALAHNSLKNLRWKVIAQPHRDLESINIWVRARAGHIGYAESELIKFEELNHFKLRPQFKTSSDDTPQRRTLNFSVQVIDLSDATAPRILTNIFFRHSFEGAERSNEFLLQGLFDDLEDSFQEMANEYR